MGEKAEYKSAIRSRKLIREAFIDLLNEKSLEKITVTDIVRRADINRGTFYAHYEDITAVVRQIENGLIEKLLESLGEYHYESFFQNPMHFLLKISGYLEEDIAIHRVLINSSRAEQFLIELKNIFIKYMETDGNIPDNIKRSPAFLTRIHFFAGGIINLYQVWFRDEIDVSLNEIAVEVSKMVTSGSTKILE